MSLKFGVKAWTGSPMKKFCERNYKISGSMKVVDFLTSLVAVNFVMDF
jgi:hypothetical protein